MSAICLIDTSVLCNLLDIPKMANHKKQVQAEFRHQVSQRYIHLVPLAVLFEIGNHISHVEHGEHRRSCAIRFRDFALKALRGELPFTVTPIPQHDVITRWLLNFHEDAMRGVGLVDVSIRETWEEQCQLHPSRRVFIWSYDKHLAGFDRAPRL